MTQERAHRFPRENQQARLSKRDFFSTVLFGAALLAAPHMYSRTLHAHSQESAIQTAQTQQTQPCFNVVFRSRLMHPPQMPIYISDYLARHNLEPNAENTRTAEERILETRKINRERPLIAGTILFGAASDIDCRNNLPLYRDAYIIDKLRVFSRDVRVFSGVNESGVGGTLAQDTAARDELLEAIKTVPTSITAILSGHGTPTGVYFNSTIILSPEQLARAYFERYKNIDIRKRAQSDPERLIIHACGSGGYARNFLRILRDLELEENRLHPQDGFRLTLPRVTTSTTGAELGYVGQLFDVILEIGEQGDFYQYESHIGNQSQFSDPEMYAPERITGEAIKIAGNQSETAFG